MNKSYGKEGANFFIDIINQDCGHNLTEDVQKSICAKIREWIISQNVDGKFKNPKETYENLAKLVLNAIDEKQQNAVEYSEGAKLLIQDIGKIKNRVNEILAEMDECGRFEFDKDGNKSKVITDEEKYNSLNAELIKISQKLVKYNNKLQVQIDKDTRKKDYQKAKEALEAKQTNREVELEEKYENSRKKYNPEYDSASPKYKYIMKEAAAKGFFRKTRHKNVIEKLETTNKEEATAIKDTDKIRRELSDKNVRKDIKQMKKTNKKEEKALRKAFSDNIVRKVFDKIRNFFATSRDQRKVKRNLMDIANKELEDFDPETAKEIHMVHKNRENLKKAIETQGGVEEVLMKRAKAAEMGEVISNIGSTGKETEKAK